MTAHHDRTLALGRKQPGRHIPIAVTNPQQVIGRLHREHLLQQLAIGIHRSDAIDTIDAMLKQKRARRLHLDSSMYQQIRALLGLDHRVERQRGHPSHELLVCLKFHVVELLARRPATVDIPGLGIERILANDGIEHDLLVITLEHASVGQRAHELNNADRIGPAIDHVAQHVQCVVGRQRDIRQGLVKRTHVPVSIRCHIDRHGTPLLALRPKPGAATKTSS